MSVEATRGQLGVYLRRLKLPSFAADHEALARTAEEGGWSFEHYLAELCEREVADRQERRIERMLRQSQLPPGKTRETLIESKLPVKARRQLATLYEGMFLKRAENVLAFGLPGRGKSHALCAVGHELVRRGHAVLFVPAYKLVQRLLAAKREFLLDRELKRLDQYEAVIIDDIGLLPAARKRVNTAAWLRASRTALRTPRLRRPRRSAPPARRAPWPESAP